MRRWGLVTLVIALVLCAACCGVSEIITKYFSEDTLSPVSSDLVRMAGADYPDFAVVSHDMRRVTDGEPHLVTFTLQHGSEPDLWLQVTYSRPEQDDPDVEAAWESDDELLGADSVDPGAAAAFPSFFAARWPDGAAVVSGIERETTASEGERYRIVIREKTTLGPLYKEDAGAIVVWYDPETGRWGDTEPRAED